MSTTQINAAEVWLLMKLIISIKTKVMLKLMLEIINAVAVHMLIKKHCSFQLSLTPSNIKLNHNSSKQIVQHHWWIILLWFAKVLQKQSLVIGNSRKYMCSCCRSLLYTNRSKFKTAKLKTTRYCILLSTYLIWLAF